VLQDVNSKCQEFLGRAENARRADVSSYIVLLLRSIMQHFLFGGKLERRVEPIARTQCGSHLYVLTFSVL
jgi:hypothetical protein